MSCSSPCLSLTSVRNGWLCLAGLAALTLPTQAIADGLDAAEREAVIDGISERLEEQYVFLDVAKNCGAHLRAQLDAGEFDEITEAEPFAQALTEALQEVSKDKHMRVRAREPERAQLERQDPVVARQNQMDRMRQANFGFERVERLDGNIGYVDMRSFSPIEVTRDTAAAALAFVSNSDAIIFDMRKNGGGSPETIQFVCSYFFDQPTHLNSLYWRAGDETQEFWTLDEIPGPRMPDVPLFVLTSNYTFSGAEEFTYNLRTRERAVIIGETTGGGANPGGSVDINDRFGIFIPTGRAINPITGTNWEGVGVEPHIACSAEEALDRALVDARKAAEAYRNSRSTLMADVTQQIQAARKLIDSGKGDDGVRAIHAALKLGREGDVLQEASINMLGYEHLQSGSVDTSIAVFTYNTQAYPRSFNVWDSLGEAYMEKGQHDMAIRYYEKSLALKPDNAHAVEMIERMRK